MTDPTNAELIERWEQCLRVLEQMPEHEREKHWNMSEWGIQTDCGTVACAAGHCGMDPWFRERGFRMDFEKCDCGVVNCFETQISNVDEFFGEWGSHTIFCNPRKRSVETVIGEVKAHIARLRALNS